MPCLYSRTRPADRDWHQYRMKNDEKTFATIVKDWYEPIYWHIRRLVVSHDDAEDIAQETFIKAYRHLWQLRDPDALKPWLYRIATNEINRHFGKKHESVELSEELVSRLEESAHVNFDDAAGVRLQKAILTLPPQQRTVFCLKYYDDMSYEEMSYVTGTRPETLKVHWHLAKKKIENLIIDE